jgi:hypothetical protein
LRFCAKRDAKGIPEGDYGQKFRGLHKTKDIDRIDEVTRLSHKIVRFLYTQAGEVGGFVNFLPELRGAHVPTIPLPIPKLLKPKQIAFWHPPCSVSTDPGLQGSNP